MRLAAQEDALAVLAKALAGNLVIDAIQPKRAVYVVTLASRTSSHEQYSGLEAADS
jgi:hypothetical protein